MKLINKIYLWMDKNFFKLLIVSILIPIIILSSIFFSRCVFRDRTEEHNQIRNFVLANSKRIQSLIDMQVYDSKVTLSGYTIEIIGKDKISIYSAANHMLFFDDETIITYTVKENNSELIEVAASYNKTESYMAFIEYCVVYSIGSIFLFMGLFLFFQRKYYSSLKD